MLDFPAESLEGGLDDLAGFPVLELSTVVEQLVETEGCKIGTHTALHLGEKLNLRV